MTYESAKCMEEEMKMMDEAQRIDSPPRKVKVEG